MRLLGDFSEKLGIFVSVALSCRWTLHCTPQSHQNLTEIFMCLLTCCAAAYENCVGLIYSPISNSITTIPVISTSLTFHDHAILCPRLLTWNSSKVASSENIAIGNWSVFHLLYAVANFRQVLLCRSVKRGQIASKLHEINQCLTVSLLQILILFTAGKVFFNKWSVLMEPSDFVVYEYVCCAETKTT